MIDIKQVKFSTDKKARQIQLFDFVEKGVGTTIGTINLQKGIRIPEKGYTRHARHEVSFLQTGKIQMLLSDGSKGDILSAGDVIHLTPNEPQAGFVMEETKIIYMLIG